MHRSSHKFASTYQYKLLGSDWDRYARRLELFYYSPQPHSLMDEIRNMVVVFRESLHEDYMLLSSTSGRLHPDLIVAVLLGFIPKLYRPHIAMFGDMWQPNKGLRHQLEKILLSLADRVIDRYIVQSSEELEEFPRLWGVDGEKMRLCLYHFSLTEDELSQPTPPVQNFIFSGGNSHRDYGPLLEAARRLPEKSFVIATSRMKDYSDIPNNVKVGQTSHEEFVRLLRSSRVVIVPIFRGMKRAVGQQTFLNAMLLGKPTIVTDVFGVRDHLTHGKTGLIVDGSSQSFYDALQWVDNPENAEAVAAMSQAARKAAEAFNYTRHVNRIATLMDELIQESQINKDA